MWATLNYVSKAAIGVGSAAIGAINGLIVGEEGQGVTAGLDRALYDAAGEPQDLTGPIQELVSKGADINSVHDWNAWTPLHRAVWNKNTNICVTLISLKADVNSNAAPHKDTPLHIAVGTANIELVGILLQAHADVNHDNYNRVGTPLHSAAFWGMTSIAKVLLANKADPHLRNSFGMTALTMARERGFQELSDVLAAAMGELDVVDEKGRVFGRALETLIEEGLCSTQGADAGVPIFLLRAIGHLREERLTSTHRIFAESAPAQELARARHLVDSQVDVNFARLNPHTVAGLIKLWLRLLPEPVLGANNYTILTNAFQEGDVALILRTAEARPGPYFNIQRHLFTFLAEVCAQQQLNNMSAYNMATAFAPSLLRAAPQDETYSRVIEDYPLVIGVVEVLITSVGNPAAAYKPVERYLMKEWIVVRDLKSNESYYLNKRTQEKRQLVPDTTFPSDLLLLPLLEKLPKYRPQWKEVCAGEEFNTVGDIRAIDDMVLACNPRIPSPLATALLNIKRSAPAPLSRSNTGSPPAYPLNQQG